MPQLLTFKHIRHAAYAPLLAASMVVMFARLLVMAWLLDIDAFATFSAGLIVSSLFALVGSLGFYPDLLRRLPAQLALGHRRAAAAQIGQTVLVVLAVGTVGAVAAFFEVSIGGITPGALMLGTIHGLSQHLFLIATTESRSSGDPLRYAAQHLLRSLATVAGGIAAAMLSGSATTVLLTEAAVGYACVLLILAVVRRRLGIGLVITFALTVRSFRRTDWVSMLALLSYTIVAGGAAQLDRWLSSVLLAGEDFARYSFVWTIVLMALSVQALVNASVYPMIVRRIAQAGTQSAHRLTLTVSASALVVCLAAIVPCWYLASVAVPHFFPEYAEVAALIPILAVTAALRISEFWSGFLIAAGRERSALIGILLAVLLAGAAWRFAIGDGPISLVHLAYLGLAVAATSYAAVFAMSWRVSRWESPRR